MEVRSLVEACAEYFRPFFIWQCEVRARAKFPIWRWQKEGAEDDLVPLKKSGRRGRFSFPQMVAGGATTHTDSPTLKFSLFFLPESINQNFSLFHLSRIDTKKIEGCNFPIFRRSSNLYWHALRFRTQKTQDLLAEQRELKMLYFPPHLDNDGFTLFFFRETEMRHVSHISFFLPFGAISCRWDFSVLAYTHRNVVHIIHCMSCKTTLLPRSRAPETWHCPRKKREKGKKRNMCSSVVSREQYVKLPKKCKAKKISH